MRVEDEINCSGFDASTININTYVVKNDSENFENKRKINFWKRKV
jgi:hypothetical protein